MAYVIDIHHNIQNKTFNVTLKYDDTSVNNPDITIPITYEGGTFALEGWTDVDASKIKVDEQDIPDGAIIYKIKNQYTEIVNQS